MPLSIWNLKERSKRNEIYYFFGALILPNIPPDVVFLR